MPIESLDHVQVAAPPGCEREARRFYGELLGLAEVAKPEALAGRGGAWFACGAQQLHVGVAEDFEAARKAHPALRVTDVAELERLGERLEYAGVAVRWDDDLPGARRFYAEDPWGNRVELLASAPSDKTRSCRLRTPSDRTRSCRLRPPSDETRSRRPRPPSDKG